MSGIKRRSMARATVLVTAPTTLLAILVSAQLGAGNSHAAPKNRTSKATKTSSAIAPAPPSKAITDAVLDAIAAEMERSKTSLRIDGATAPYFIGYKVTEVEVNDVVAQLGSASVDAPRHFVNLEAHVHVGDYAFDNTNFIASGREGLDGTAALNLPLEPNTDIARRVAWLVTDAAFKEAIEQIQAKEEALKSGAAGGRTGVPSYTKPATPAPTATQTAGGATIFATSKSVPKLEERPALRARAEKISAAFRKHAHVRDSRVAFTSYLERRWLLNTEGRLVHDTRRVSGVLIVASSQADDGQELALHYSRYGHTAADLPSDTDLLRAADDLAAKLLALKSAPVVESYSGPVLFEDNGAVGVVREALALQLSGTPLPIGLSAAQKARFGAGLTDRLGLRVLAQQLSITDDPTTNTVDGTALIGGYGIDDEGTPAEKVKVVEAGTLKQLLMSRTPSAKMPRTNGHARLSMEGGIFRGSATNLFVEAKGGLSDKQLRARLLSEVKSQGLPYGIIIRQFDDAAITANPELTRFERLQLLQSVDPEAPPLAQLAYRVYPNGREELVRGVQLKPIGIRAWRDIVGVSRDRTVRNFLASVEDPLLMQVSGGTAGMVPSAGVESSIATPDLLFSELDLVPSTLGRRPPPAIPAP